MSFTLSCLFWVVVLALGVVDVGIGAPFNLLMRGEESNSLELGERRTTLRGGKNLFFDWLAFSSRQVTSRNHCIICFDKRRFPEAVPFPFGLDSCDKNWRNGEGVCPMQCVMDFMANPEGRPIETPRCANFSMSTLAGNSFVPPMVTIPVNMVYPLCLISYRVRDARKLECSDYVPGFECAGRVKLPLKCREATMTGGVVPSVPWANGTVRRHPVFISVGGTGTRSVADIFWYCGGDRQIRDSLEPGWNGVCAPVMLTNSLSIMPTDSEGNRVRRDLSDLSFEPDPEVQVSFFGPRNIPYEHQAMSESTLSQNPVFFPARNGLWINYLWYNQQRFFNYTITGFELIREQLHATSIMAMQNRFILDSLLAEEQGVCMRIGAECCTVIPMHTGKGGNLTKVIKRLHNLRDEHVANTAGGSPPWGDWFLSGAWKAVLVRIGLILALVLASFMVLTCCVFPLLQGMVRKTVASLTGQFAIMSPGVLYRGHDGELQAFLSPRGAVESDFDDDLYVAPVLP